MAIIQDTSANSKLLPEKEIQMDGTKYDMITKPVINNIDNVEDMMAMLIKHPKLRLEVFNVLYAKSEKEKQLETSKNTPGCVSETSNVVFGDDVKSTAEDALNDKLKVGSNQTRMVLSTSKLPQSRPNYAMNNNADKPLSPSHEMLVAVPQEPTPTFEYCVKEAPSKDITTDSVDAKCASASLVTLDSIPEMQTHAAPVQYKDASHVQCEDAAHVQCEDALITVDSVENAEYTTQNSNNFTLSAAEINSCKAAKAFPNITECEEKKQICSEEYSFQLLYSQFNNRELDTFCEIMNSPNYVFSESSVPVACNGFQNSIAQSPDDLGSSPAYAISSKPVTVNVTTPSLYQQLSPAISISNTIVASPTSTSVCDDSDLENDSHSENWDSLINLSEIYNSVLQDGSSSIASSPYASHYMGVDESSQDIYSCNVSVTSETSMPCADTFVNSNLMGGNTCLRSNVKATQVEHSCDIDLASPQSTFSIDHNLGSPESTVSSSYEFYPHNIIDDPIEETNNLPNLDWAFYNGPLTDADISVASPSSTAGDALSVTQLLPEVFDVSQISEWFDSIVQKQHLEPVKAETTEQCDDDYESSPKKRQKLNTEVSIENPFYIPNSNKLVQIMKNQPVEDDSAANVVAEECKRNHPVFKKDGDGDLPLHIAIAQEDVAAAKNILKIMNAQQLDTLNKDLQTPLHLASYLENAEIIRSLLDNGAKAEISDKDGNNVIHIACERRSTEIFNVLHQCCYTKEPLKIAEMMIACNNEGLTPTHIATKNRDMNAIKYLIQFGCNLDVKDMKSGTTPLIYALRSGDWELARIFIEHGACVNVPTNSGMYPLDYVGISDNLILAKDLISRNAESGVKTEFTNDKMKILFETELRKRRRKRNRDARRE